ncbi:DUF4159 domain-containing protein [Rhodospirillum sp. A1_3_36]|uniref:DUF4159 domain-containing protein n=1 Tax=Rhodospirillum sp. A1_3_36 TaxID=3391666 RepID=UPI0039A4C452
MTLGSLTIAAPWVLAALIALPALWWLLRVTPPAPRRQNFPAVRLLKGLRSDEHVTAHTPWWLLLLRLAVAALVILGLSRPLIDAEGGRGSAAQLILVIDDDWASAADWAARMDAAGLLLDRAEREDRPVTLITTAARSTEDPASPPEPLSATGARALLQALTPKPWATDPEAVRTLLAQSTLTPPARVSWIQDGLAAPGVRALAETLEGYGPLTVWHGTDSAKGSAPLLLSEPRREGSALKMDVRRPARAGTPGATAWILARDAQDRLVQRERFTFAPGASLAQVTLPAEIVSAEGATRLDLALGEAARPLASAGATVLLDDSWQRRPIGLVLRTDSQGVPLLDPLHYPRRALMPRTMPEEGSILDLVERPLSVILLPDIIPLPPAEEAALDRWIRAGGTLIRFAGPRPDNRTDSLLPVPLRGGDRRLGGALSWSEPAHLAPFPADSPFAGLTVPRDVTVASQVLADPTADLETHTWARLDDGTPLVTAANRGQGRIVLFHVTSDPRWSNLPLSGVFPRMLDRVVDLANGIAGPAGRQGASLAPWRVFDGFGRLGPAGPLDHPLTLDAPGGTERGGAGGTQDGAGIGSPVGPGQPPGLYGDETSARALNLAPSITDLSPATDWPTLTRLRALNELGRAIDLMPWLLTLALVLALLDLALSLILRGLGPGGRRWTLGRGAAGGAAGVGLLLTAFAFGQPQSALAQNQTTAPDPMEVEAALDTRLAYVRSPDPGVNRVTEAGLAALTEVLGRRTSAELAPPQGLDLETDDPLVYPVLYWPVVADAPPLSEAARERVNAFMRGGGLLVIDTRDGGDARPLAEGLDIPPLIQTPQDHVLTRSFYLLDDFPGRVTGNPTWVAAQGGDNDGVSPVVIGGNDWAAAWANEPDRGYLFPVSPGGERQREMAYRFGVNLVMYALTGNYKGDQVHLPAILERLTN